MRKLSLLAPALLLAHTAAQSLPNITFKEGLWEEVTASTIEPTGTTSGDTSSSCHSHAYDARQMQRAFNQECHVTSSAQTDAGWQMDSTCSGAGMPPGMSVGMKMTATVVDEEHTNIEIATAYPRNMPGGMTGTHSVTTMTYKGPCPPDMKPGDKLMSLPNGKSTIIPAPSAEVENFRARGLRQVSPSPRASSMSLAQSTTPALNSRPAPARATSGPPLTNADVIALATAGLDDAVILAKIQSAPATRFDSSIDGLKALKAGGVSNAVIKVIVGTASAAEAEVAASSDDPNVMHQPGVYALISGRDGQVHLLQLEHTHAAGENMSGNTLTMAYLHTKKHTRESLNNPTSPVKIEDRNPTFYIYIPQDTQAFGGNDLSARDFELLKLRVKSKTREVETASQSMTGMGTTGIEEKARQNTTAQKVKPGIYLVKVSTPLKPGEYAFQHELEGVFYDFTITESR